jgi:hypothetical protein
LAQKKITAKMSAKSKIKSKVSSFTEESFLEQAKEIYNDAHTALMKLVLKYNNTFVFV